MTKRLKKIRVFAASPSDVKEERSRLSGIVEELNRTIGPEKGLVLELVRWETHVTPSMGRAQEIINQQIGPYDIFVGIMWKRFGTPTGGADSGTEEEFDLAFASWKIARKPRIMFYFNQAKYVLNTPQEAEQVRRLLEFRMRLEKQALIWTYDGPDEFERTARQHLQDAVREFTTQAKKGKSLHTEDGFENHSVREPVQELFDNAFAEWKRHRVFASRDRLELFRQNVTMVDSSQEQVRFIVESWFKSREYNPQDFLKSYNMDDIVRICVDIIEKEKDIDLTNGAIKVLGDQDTARSAEILLRIIESHNEYHENNRLTAIERFWFSKAVNAPDPRIPSQHAPNIYFSQ